MLFWLTLVVDIMHIFLLQNCKIPQDLLWSEVYAEYECQTVLGPYKIQLNICKTDLSWSHFSVGHGCLRGAYLELTPKIEL